MSTAANKASGTVLAWTERGLVPDSVIRAGIRRLCRQRLKEIGAHDSKSAANMEHFVDMMNASVIALVPELANEQHYEVPPEFFMAVLGVHAKYSCCYWGEGGNIWIRPRQRLLSSPASEPELKMACPFST